jgi:hypothetical protein
MMATRSTEPRPTRASRRSGCTAFLAIVALLATAGSARAAATMTYPTDGQTVTLDKKLGFTFTWTLLADEFGPSVYVGDTPTYNPDPFYALAPFEPFCGVDVGQIDASSSATSCRGNADALPVPPGTHYALIKTTNADGSQIFISPVVRFIVPYKLGFGCSPLQPGCHELAVQSLYYPFGDEVYPWKHSLLVVRGWFNGPRVTFTFTIKRGSKVLKRLHQTRSTDSQVYYADSNFKLYRLRGVPGGTRLSCVITISGGGVKTSRTVKIRAGAGPKVGTVFG